MSYSIRKSMIRGLTTITLTALFLVGTTVLSGLNTVYAQQRTPTDQRELLEESARPVAPHEQLSSPSYGHDLISPMHHETVEAHFTPRNTGSNEISSFIVGDVFVDSNSRLFIQTQGWVESVDVYDGSDWQHLEIAKELRTHLNQINEDADGDLWFATGKGLYVYDSGFSLKDSVKVAIGDTLSPITRKAVFDDSGRVWIAHPPKVDRKWTGSKYVNILKKAGGLSVYMPDQDSLWYDLDLQSKAGPNMTLGRINDLLVRPNGNVWATVAPTDSTEGGIAVIPPSRDTTWSYQKANSNLPSDNVNKLAEDGQGNVWTCFFRNKKDSTVGAASFDGSQWTSYTASNSPLESSCRELKTTGSNSVYYGSRDTLMKFDGSSWSAMPGTMQERPLAGITSIADGFNGKTVFSQRHGFAKSSGVFIKDGSSLEFMSSSTDGGLFSNVIFTTSVDTAGNLWASGFYGVAKYDGSTWEYFNEKDGLTNPYVWKIHAASNGTIWFGTTRNGLTYLENDEIKVYDKLETFYGESIFEDSQGNIWLGSFGGKNPGILQYDGENFTHYDTTAGVIRSNVTSFAEDANGNIIASSNSPGAGFARFDTATGNWSSWTPDTAKNIFSREINSDVNGNVWIPHDSLYMWDGSSLTAYALPDEFVGAIHVESDPEGNVWIGGRGSQVFSNESWYHPLQLNHAFVYGISHDMNGDSWHGTFADGIYKVNRGQAVAIEKSEELPGEFELGHNYPNPFNPTTNIEFSLPHASDVQLTVYNVLGRRVATLVDGKRQAGRHTVTFDAGHLSSGVYIYQLKSDNFTKTYKMLLVK